MELNKNLSNCQKNVSGLKTLLEQRFGKEIKVFVLELL